MHTQRSHLMVKNYIWNLRGQKPKISKNRDSHLVQNFISFNLTFFVCNLVLCCAIYDGSNFRPFTSLKRHFLKSFSFDLHKIFREGVKLLSHKVLKLSCRYLDSFRSYGEYPGGRGGGSISPRGARVNNALRIKNEALQF